MIIAIIFIIFIVMTNIVLWYMNYLNENIIQDYENLMKSYEDWKHLAEGYIKDLENTNK